MTEPGGYVLGHAEAELNRLATQAVLIDPITRRFFRAAGIAEGMRVLDVGSGAGHTAMLLAEIVGPSGEVVGVDRAPVAVQTAERRVAAAGLGNVSFRHGDPSQMRLDGGFDAVAGRYVLMFVPAAADMLRGLLRHLRPGGRIVFHEPDWNGTRSSPPVPAFEQVCGWIRQALLASGASDDFGLHLAEVFAGGRPRRADPGARGHHRRRSVSRRRRAADHRPRHDATTRHAAPRHRPGRHARLRRPRHRDPAGPRPARHRASAARRSRLGHASEGESAGFCCQVPANPARAG